MASMVQAPSSTSAQATIGLLTSIPITHPSFASLIDSLQPLSQPSGLPSSQLNKLLSRLNTAVLSKDESENRPAFELARKVVLQDTEGYALNNWGKAWVTAALSAVAVSCDMLGSNCD